MNKRALATKLLLDDQADVLWDRQYRRELMRFLRRSGNVLDDQTLGVVIRKILRGPSANRYRGSLTIKQWHERRNHQRRVLLFKLQQSGVQLPQRAERVLQRIQERIPWTPSEDHSEEFNIFLSGRMVPDIQVHTSKLNFAEMSAADFVEWAQSVKGRLWECGDGWQPFVSANAGRAINLLAAAAELGEWPPSVWYTVLEILSRVPTDEAKPTQEANKAYQYQIGITLSRMPDAPLAELALVAARWLEVAYVDLSSTLRKSLRNRLWLVAASNAEEPEQIDYDLTLNHAGGLLANVLYRDLTERIPKIEPGHRPGLPSDLRDEFDFVASSPTLAARLARMRLAPMLFALYAIDPMWTAAAFFARMDPDVEDLFDVHIWEAYLWHCRWSDDLLRGMKPLFFKILRHLDLVPERVRNHGPQLFVYMAVPPDRGISTAEAKSILFTFTPAYLADAAWALRDTIMGAGEKSVELWQKTVGPWFRDAWPKRNGDRSPQLSEKLAWLAVDSNTAFPAIVDAIGELLVPEEHETALFHLLSKNSENQLVERYPAAALRLVDKLVGTKTVLIGDSLAEILPIIGRHDELANSPTFKRLLQKVG